MKSISLLVLLLIAAEVQSSCYSTSRYYATTVLRAVQYYYYSNNDNCVIYIIPDTLYRSGYYLELKWTTFDIEGRLPTCIDYVEVFLTRSERSIGRYCSGNSASATLFNMYSSDGYATIRFKSDGSITKRGFRFTYELKRIHSEYIGTYGDRTCYFTEDYSSSGLFYSAGWPKGYNSGTCYHRIYVPAGKELRIAVMNLNLRNARVFCDNANDNFEIRGSNILYSSLSSIRWYAATVSARHCGAFHPGYFTTRYRYAYLIVNKPFGSYPLFQNYGFMIGYTIYDATTVFPTNPLATTSGARILSDEPDKDWGKHRNVASSIAARIGAAVSALTFLLIGVIN